MYNKKKERLEKALPRKEVAMKVMTRFSVDLEKSAICLDMEKIQLIKTIKDLLSFSSQTKIERPSDYGQVVEDYCNRST